MRKFILVLLMMALVLVGCTGKKAVENSIDEPVREEFTYQEADEYVRKNYYDFLEKMTSEQVGIKKSYIAQGERVGGTLKDMIHYPILANEEFEGTLDIWKEDRLLRWTVSSRFMRNLVNLDHPYQTVQSNDIYGPGKLFNFQKAFHERAKAGLLKPFDKDMFFEFDLAD